ncbi:YebC/PmpR family DNA-binding transcriptional regulator [Chitinispirillales bacterium ANBcel5]|uniref:YebC/PmpR family DNA-binding transcriptional regulator n=1 Tax=Cellulosispirillum alkaliphilum TaxID=3039283 RepID=UPI002A57FDA4|nr:YebC/PmpR family DNA-binding transcriptional regulator [Chitinispirillales bacterium ANBcel5]
MSGHSKWATIKRAKGKADAARGKLFNRLIREISIAARMGGGDITANPRLRSAVTSARAANMPSKNIETAIQKGTGQLEGVTYEEITFEGYGPGGVAIMIESMTDNRNRTVAEVRHALSKHGGNLGQSNSVAWMFKSKGVIRVAKDQKPEDELMEIALEAGAEDMALDGDEFEISTDPESFESVREALTNVGIEPASAEVTKIAENPVKVEGDTAVKVLKLIDILDELDDTQNVYAAFDIDDEEMDKLR